MVEIKDPIIKDREDEFIADEISFLNFVVSDYSKPKLNLTEEQISKEYDNQTSALQEERRNQCRENAEKEGKNKQAALAKIAPELIQFKKDRD